MWRHFAANALTFFVVALFLLAGVILWGGGQYRAPGPLAQAICLNVPAGSTMRGVSEDLAAQGAISSPTIFRIGVDYADKASELKAGRYLLPQGVSMEEIADIVTRGGASTCGTEVVYRVGVNRTLAEVRTLDPASGEYGEVAEFEPGVDPVPPEYEEVKAEPDTTYRVVVAEGVTSWQVVQALNGFDILEGDVEEVPPEGTLATQDYTVAPGTPVADLLARMAEDQSAILAAAWEGRAANLPVETPEEALILASIVEKETGVAAERPVVASVFVNRLNEGMRLQTDPTVIYGITRGQGILGRGLRQSELQGRTDWNTYVIDGLPPTPIANPGRAAIEAALNPASTDYLFFVADGTGGHVFAETLDEHNANVARWREIEARMAEEAAAQDGDGDEDDAPAPTR